MTLTDLLTEQRAALEAGNPAQALDILDQIEREVSKANAWDWLTTHEPENYDQLCQKLEDARETVSKSGRSELGSLIDVFQWCEKHGISLTKLDTPAHMSKYREAASYLRGIIKKDDAKAELLKAIERIQSDRTRRETREWVR
jgi:hypothetical protein